MPKQNHLIGGKKSSKKSSKKNSSFTGKRFIGNEKSKKETRYESDSEGNTTSEMRKILDIQDNNSFRGSEQMPQRQMQQMPMQQMQQQMPMQQMDMMSQMQQQMPMQQMPMMGKNDFDPMMVETLAPMKNPSNIGNLSKLNPMAGLSQLPQYSELESYNTQAQGMMPMMGMPQQMAQQMGTPMNGLNNLAQLGRMF
jgi:hypothetical protein